MQLQWSYVAHSSNEHSKKLDGYLLSLVISYDNIRNIICYWMQYGQILADFRIRVLTRKAGVAGARHTLWLLLASS